MGRFVRTVIGADCFRLRSLSALLLVGLCALSSGAEAFGATSTDLQVQSSTREGVRFSLSGLQAVWRPVPVRDDALTLYDLQLTGFSSAGPVGSPRIPTRGGWLVVPPGTRPEVRTISEQWIPAVGQTLMVEMTPVIQRGVESYDSGVSEILVLPGESVPDGYDVTAGALAALAKRGARVLNTAVTLGEIGWWRGRRVVPFRISGVLTDGQGKARQVLSAGDWEVRFVPDKAFAGQEIPEPQMRRRGSRNDDKFGGAFLNANLMSQLSAEAVHHGVEPSRNSKATGARGQKSGSLLGFESRLAVTKTKLHRVSYERLRSRNLLPDVPVQEAQIRLYQRRYLADLDDGSGAAPYAEIEVPVHMVGEGDAFDGDDFFVFYGLRLRDDVDFNADLGDGLVTVPGAGDPHEQDNEANTYWLAASEPEAGTPWARMESMTLPASSGVPLANYRRAEHVEEQEAFRENLPNVSSDRMYYNNNRAREVTAAINPLFSPDLAGTDVDLQVGITGWNTFARPVQMELVTGETVTPLDEFDIFSTSEVIKSYTVAPGMIDGPSTRVRMLNPNGTFIFSYLNWVKIAYDALYQVTNNRLDFHLGTDGGARPVEVAGFTDADLGLYEITDPRRPKLVQLSAANIVADGATWKLSVMPDQTVGQQRTFFAVGEASTAGIEEFVTFRSSAALDPVVPTQLGGADPDLIVITHEDFTETIGRWVDHRIARSGGQLRVHVVEIQDLFDWYSGGLKSAWAIKRFTNHAITRWDSWALMVVGDANENVLGKEVLAQARDWSTDWVPTHYHVQNASGFSPELMASDKWFASLSAGADYPNDIFPFDVSGPWDIYNGRFPCNSVGELNNMIDKVITVEDVQAGQDWRKRGIFIADDEWSNGLGVQALSELTYKVSEERFGISERDSLGTMWAGRAAVPLDSVVVLLKPYMDAGFPYELPPPPASPEPRDLGDAREYCAAVATNPLLQALSAGGLVAHYQGHANPYVLTSEFWFEDRRIILGRDDVDRLNNTNKPWVFMGMGCHIADWAQNAVRSDVVPNEPSLSEKMLIRANAGASAIYASSGFEFISANREFGEYIFRRWVDNPPAARSVGGGGADVPIRSRWMTGELLWAAEADIQAQRPWYPYTEMIAQYVILGDPLMMLDAGPALTTAILLGNPDQEINGEVDLVAIDATNLRTINLEARDEAGIDRLQVVDTNGNDLTGQVAVESLPDGAINHRIMNYVLNVPVRPFDHSLTVKVYDSGGALPTDRHTELVLNMPQTATFVSGGEIIEPDDWVFQADQPVSVTARVTSSAQLNDTMVMDLTSETLTLSNVVFNFNKGRELDVDFTAVAANTNPDDMHLVVLTIDGLPTELVMQSGAGATSVEGIGQVFNFPNPMHEETRFIFRTEATAGNGVIRVYSVAGSAVAEVKFLAAANGDNTVFWDGRDNRADELGNGTYLYRVEIDAPGGRLVSDMQRLRTG